MPPYFSFALLFDNRHVVAGRKTSHDACGTRQSPQHKEVRRIYSPGLWRVSAEAPVQLTTLVPLRVIAIALLGGSFAIFANMLWFMMIGKINERVPENERISYFWWGTEVRSRYKQLYPAGKLALLTDLCAILMVLFFLLIIRFWVFGSSSTGK
jgi:hypothetical protein